MLAIPAVCFGSMWLFARFGGEWATAAELPVPPDSQLLRVIYEDDYAYRDKTSVYAHPSPPEALREWFVQAGISMSPIPLNMEKTSFIQYDNYYGTPTPFHLGSSLSRLHATATMFTHGWFEDFTADCQAVRVYKSIALAAEDFPDLKFGNATSIFAITNCWPLVP
ncbi:MAG: hypothetical protein LCI00_16340 [Chloroflexi bacterium]|nr:hypothetical protein [Chloroflexota bacterium]MCC6892802.1 hypothetical protein [Anaerolineae bacterium]